jgi:hypothetical protein
VVFLIFQQNCPIKKIGKKWLMQKDIIDFDRLMDLRGYNSEANARAGI